MQIELGNLLDTFFPQTDEVKMEQEENSSYRGKRPRSSSSSTDSVSLKSPRSWSKEEDDCLRKFVDTCKSQGIEVDFRYLELTGRTTKQCRERYENSLDPTVKRGEWSIEESYVLANHISKLGQNWTAIKDLFPSRTYNGIKKRGHKLLGEIRQRSRSKYIRKKPSINMSDDWTAAEIVQLKKLHKQYGDQTELILSKLEVLRSSADVDRKLLEICSCSSCTSRCNRIRAIVHTEGISFKEAWSKETAERVKQTLFERLQHQKRRSNLNKEPKESRTLELMASVASSNTSASPAYTATTKSSPHQFVRRQSDPCGLKIDDSFLRSHWITPKTSKGLGSYDSYCDVSSDAMEFELVPKTWI